MGIDSHGNNGHSHSHTGCFPFLPIPIPNFLTNSHSHGNPMGFPFPLGIPFPWSSLVWMHHRSLSVICAHAFGVLFCYIMDAANCTFREWLKNRNSLPANITTIVNASKIPDYVACASRSPVITSSAGVLLLAGLRLPSLCLAPRSEASVFRLPFYARQHLVLSERVLAIVILSVRLSWCHVPEQNWAHARQRHPVYTLWQRRVSSLLRANFVPLGEEFLLGRGHQRWVPRKKLLLYRY